MGILLKYCYISEYIILPKNRWITMDIHWIEQQNLKSFKQLDEQYLKPKGTTFRIFKSLLPEWKEGVHYYYLNHQQYFEIIKQLKNKEWIYQSDIHVVLLSPLGQQILKVKNEN